jgi:glycosyltransferase involved in cell wall biosynthesis
MIENMDKKTVNAPQVSIGMPVYNGERYIKDALDSLLAQTFADFELIISDNASTDGTSVICREYAGKDNRIRYIRQPENLGPLNNFQFVLSLAKGVYFMWAACDDRRVPTSLERMTEVLKRDEDCGLVFSNYIERDLESGNEKFHKVSPSNSNSRLYNYAVRILNMSPSFIYGLYRTDKIKDKKVECFDFSDVHFVAEIVLRTRIRVINDYLYIAGTKGYREPYSLTHKKINRTVFLHKQYALLNKHFYFPITQCLFFLVCLVMAYNKIRLWRY